MIFKLSDYILENTISDVSISDIALEQAVAEVNVNAAICEACMRQMYRSIYMEDGESSDNNDGTSFIDKVKRFFISIGNLFRKMVIKFSGWLSEKRVNAVLKRLEKMTEEEKKNTTFVLPTEDVQERYTNMVNEMQNLCDTLKNLDKNTSFLTAEDLKKELQSYRTESKKKATNTDEIYKYDYDTYYEAIKKFRDAINEKKNALKTILNDIKKNPAEHFKIEDEKEAKKLYKVAKKYYDNFYTNITSSMTTLINCIKSAEKVLKKNPDSKDSIASGKRFREEPETIEKVEQSSGSEVKTDKDESDKKETEQSKEHEEEIVGSPKSKNEVDIDFLKNNKNILRSFTRKDLFQFNQTNKSEKLDETIHEQLDLLIDKIDGAKTFGEYKPLFDVLCDILGFSNDGVLAMHGWITGSGQGQIRAYEKAQKRPVSQSDVLYHGSKVGGITALRPTFKRSDDKDFNTDKGKVNLKSIEVLYPSERVYVHINKPGSRFGSGSSSEHTYIVKDTKSVMNNIYYDSELRGSSAAYIETSNEIPVYEMDKTESSDDTDKKKTEEQSKTVKKDTKDEQQIPEDRLRRLEKELDEALKVTKPLGDKKYWTTFPELYDEYKKIYDAIIKYYEDMRGKLNTNEKIYNNDTFMQLFDLEGIIKKSDKLLKIKRERDTNNPQYYLPEFLLIAALKRASTRLHIYHYTPRVIFISKYFMDNKENKEYNVATCTDAEFDICIKEEEYSNKEIAKYRTDAEKYSKEQKDSTE